MGLEPVVGVDIGKTGHYAVCLDHQGTRLWGHPLGNRQAEIDELVGRAAANSAAVVVDQPNGGAALLIQACWDAGVTVGYLHGLAMARARDFYEGEAKTDPKDAFVIADVARAHPGRIVWLEAVPDERARLELLCGYDEDLRADINRIANRLRSLLAAHWPELEQAIAKRLPGRALCQMLASYPHPDALRRAGKTRLTRFLRTRRLHRPELFVEQVLVAIGEQHTVVAGAQAAGRLVADIAADLDRLLGRREELAKEIEKCFFAQPEAGILTSLPGVGPRLGARILVEVGEITRFATPSKLAAYAGLGPSTRQSGTSINTCVSSRRGNHRLKNALFLAAFASLRHPPSRAYYDRKRAQGRRHNEAILCLARRRIDVLHAMLTRGELYHWSPIPEPDLQVRAA
ncbi:MAG: IS110 family transposase [Actinomycetota bacterium]